MLSVLFCWAWVFYCGAEGEIGGLGVGGWGEGVGGWGLGLEGWCWGEGVGGRG
jgi:hypothetical protein